MNIALTLLTCNKPDLVAQSCKPLLAGAVAGHYHLYIADGSTSEANEKAIWEMTYPTGHMTANIRGGAGAAIVYALTSTLQHEENYSHVGLVESDVMLHDGWLECFDLFSAGESDGLSVGAVSARCFEDRVLFQRDGYAVCHNLGAGMIVLTRQAAQIVLDNFRTMWTTDNRRIFNQLCGVDIGHFWAFKLAEHFLTADWGWDATLAAHGLASLALTPSPVEMIGQNPPLAEQGLRIVGEVWKNPPKNDAWYKYFDTTLVIRKGCHQLGVDTKFHYDVLNSTWTYFPHQMAMLGGEYSGDWRLQECRGWGTFAWRAGKTTPPTEFKGALIRGFYNDSQAPVLTVPIFGPCSVLISGGKSGGQVQVEDESSGFKAAPDLPPEGENNQVLQLMVPGALNSRMIRITALTPGVVFYGVQTREKQPHLPHISFNHAMLPTP